MYIHGYNRKSYNMYVLSHYKLKNSYVSGNTPHERCPLGLQLYHYVILAKAVLQNEEKRLF
jgi:hypothetical protein